MGEYTNGQLIIYQCPPEEVVAFQRHMEEWGLLDDWLGDPPSREFIKLGHNYASNDVRIGMTFDSDLSTEAPNSAWVQWLEPKYEWNGDIEMFTPELGRFYASCDVDGNVIVSEEQLLELINDRSATLESIREGVRRLYGTPWREAFGEMASEGTVKPAPRCGWCDELIVKQDEQWVHRDNGTRLCAEQVVRYACLEEEE